ncbi:MAG: FliH/SctL family protein [Limnobacter sp.]|nr:FliH/SctL family protein [Limnobacter sp.]
MPLSDRILRGDVTKNLTTVKFGAVGHLANNPVERLYSDLGTLEPTEPQAPPMSEEEKRLFDWEQQLQAREQQLAELERQTIEKATQVGQQKGYEAGWDAAHQERVTLIQAAENLREQFHIFQASLGDKVLDLACLVARKVMGDSVEQNLSQVCVALNEIIHTMCLSPDNLTLAAHPDTLNALKAQFGDESELSQIKLRADHTLMPGGFVLHHPEGEVDASMETRWSRSIEALGRSMPVQEDTAEASDE